MREETDARVVRETRRDGGRKGGMRSVGRPPTRLTSEAISSRPVHWRSFSCWIKSKISLSSSSSCVLVHLFWYQRDRTNG